MSPIKKKPVVKNVAPVAVATAKVNTMPVTKVVTPVKTAQPAKVAAPAKTSSAKASGKVSAEERMRMIEQAAYFIAEKAGFQGDPQEHWNAAEKQIDGKLAGKK